MSKRLDRKSERMFPVCTCHTNTFNMRPSFALFPSHAFSYGGSCAVCVFPSLWRLTNKQNAPSQAKRSHWRVLSHSRFINVNKSRSSLLSASFSVCSLFSTSLSPRKKELGEYGDRGSDVPGWVKHPLFKGLVVAGLVMGALSPVFLKVRRWR